jgi:site-specific DNA-cytosine methylase
MTTYQVEAARTFASLFSGGEGAGVGARQAGYTHLWGIEYWAEAVECARVNGFDCIHGSVLTTRFRTLAAPTWLHLSPPCVTASVANAKAGESLMDAALASACCEAIDELMPAWVSLENVWGYRKYASFKAIVETLEEAGYKVVWGKVNSADIGVPQTRERLILVASRVAVPRLPQPTHTKAHTVQQLDLFAPAPLLPWVGWYEAIADLIPTLPDSKLAKWQLERLPEDLCTHLLVAGMMNEYGKSVTFPEGDAPTFGINAQNTTRQPLTAVLVGDQRSHDGQPVVHRGGENPAFVVDTRPASKYSAVLVSAENSTSAVQRDGDAPSMAIRAGIAEHNSEPRAVLLQPAHMSE